MRKMKDSGIEWIGEIPEDWKIQRAKFLFRQRSEKGNKNPVLLSPTQKNGVVPQSELEGVVKLKEETDLQSLRTVHSGDYIISLRSFQGGFELSNLEGVCSPAYQVFFPIADNISHQFFKYLFKSETFIEKINNLTTGIREGKNILYADFANILLPVPYLSEQVAIANFLDEKCAVIDRLVERHQEVIEKLKAYRQSVISEAVTRGLDPDAPMKDSGIPWIGKIPEDWTISNVKREFENLDEKRKPISAENRTTSHSAYDYYGASGIIDQIDDYIFDETLILIGEDGANLILRNLPLIYIAKGKYWVNNHAHILRPRNMNNLYYMAYQLECIDLTNYITGSTQPKLTQTNLSKIPVVCPPHHEQTRIAAHLDKKCVIIDDLLARKQSLIAKLTEYKKSLIYEYVTGKKEVPAS